MEHTLGLGPVTASRIVAGAWRMSQWDFSLEQRLGWIHGALERGVSTFDHADIYGNYDGESLFGEALAREPGLRVRMQLVSKCNIMLKSGKRPAHRVKHYDSSAEHITESVHASLKNLRTDHLDVLLLHRPDMLLDADEVASAFDSLQRAGKVLAFGASNFTSAQFELLASRTPLVTNQVELSPLELSVLRDGTLDQCQRLRIAPMIWSPLAGGELFTSKDEIPLRVRSVLERIGQDHGVSAETVAFAFILRHPSRPMPIVGSRRLESMDHAVKALSCSLDRQTWYEILEAATGAAVP
jgi:predicted oxidoreductase